MDSSVKMPINELFDWLTDFITKKTKNLILSEVNIDDFNSMATFEDLKNIIESIERNIFEDSLIEEKQDILKYFFN